MRVRRGLLFWGLLLVPLGAIPLLERAGVVAASQLTEVWRLWPLVLVALGLGLLLGRGRAGPLGTALLALVLGILGGGALASGSGLIGDVGACGGLGPDATDQRREASGTFAADATATIDVDCGSIDVVVVPGSDWTVDAGYRGEAPQIDASATSLTVRSPEGFGADRHTIAVALPADRAREIEVRANAGTGTLILAGATLAVLDAELNAGDLRLDATGATVDRLNVSVNAGRVRLTIDAHPVAGDISANAGSIELCVPADVGLVLRVEEQLTFSHDLRQRGLTQDGSTWTRIGSAGAPIINLSIDGNAASFTLDPEGGCG